MRIVVCVKQVYDPKTVKISRSREELDLRDAVKILNPPDKYALEAALRLREAAGGEVIALTVGGPEAEDVAHEAVAIGADKAILVTGEPASSFQLAASNIVTLALAAAVGKLGPVDLVLTGQTGLTDGTGSLAPRLAAALDWPVLIDVAQLDADAAGLPRSSRAKTAGRSCQCRPQPCLRSCPAPSARAHPHPARIANAWNDGMVEVWTAADLGLTDLSPDTELDGLILGPERTRGQVIKGSVQESAAELVGLLKSRRLV